MHIALVILQAIHSSTVMQFFQIAVNLENVNLLLTKRFSKAILSKKRFTIKL